jgi:hypothetical protein
MVVKRRRKTDVPAPVADGEAGKLSHMPSLAHDDDERPSREDMNYGSTIFTRPTVPLPRFLRGDKKKRAS